MHRRLCGTLQRGSGLQEGQGYLDLVSFFFSGVNLPCIVESSGGVASQLFVLILSCGTANSGCDPAYQLGRLESWSDCPAEEGQKP